MIYYDLFMIKSLSVDSKLFKFVQNSFSLVDNPLKSVHNPFISPETVVQNRRDSYESRSISLSFRWRLNFVQNPFIRGESSVEISFTNYFNII